MTQVKRPAKISTLGHVIQRTDLDYSFIFSQNIEDWIGSAKRRAHNKRAYEYNKKSRLKKQGSL